MRIDERNKPVKEKADAIWMPGLNLPIPQWRDRLLQPENILEIASRSMVLQEITEAVPLLDKPADNLRPASMIAQRTPVLVIREHFEWYLIAVMRDPWLMGWVKKSAVRTKTDFIPVVNAEHYLETRDGRHFPRIVPYKRGYGNLFKKLDPTALPPKYNIKYIIMHCTTGTRMESTINHFLDPASGVSTHLLIGRDGRVVQFLPFNRIGHHAGHSWWENEKHLNNFSIGIELDNTGRLRWGKDGEGREGWISRKVIIPENHVERAAHWRWPKHNQIAWETYPPVQLEVAWKIVKVLKETYPIVEILGHDVVNLLNREDPGPLLTKTMQDWRQKLFLNRKEPKIMPFYLREATDLLRNFGSAVPNESTSLYVPGTLPGGSEVVLIGKYDPTSAWTKISVKQSRKAQALRNKTGWVRTNSLVPVIGKGQKGGRQMGNDKKGRKPENKNRPPKPVVIRQFTVKNDQPFYKIVGGEPTPRQRLEAGVKVRRQEDKIGQWTLVVVMDSINGEVGAQGWVKSKLLSEKPVFKPKAGSFAVPGRGVPLWQHKDDEQLEPLKLAPFRPHPRGDPAVFPLEKSAAARVNLTREWQFFIRAINHKMIIQKVSAIFGYLRAFTNLTGFGDPKHPRADFIKGENLSRPLPQFDKVRTCALSVMTGVVQGDHLIIEMMNGSQPPPLKPGCVLPERIEDVRPEIYEFTPQTHRHLFFAANITSRGGKKVSPFPGGGPYNEWTGDDHAYTWLPHVAPAGIKIRYPLVYLTKLEPGAPIPKPYKP